MAGCVVGTLNSRNLRTSHYAQFGAVHHPIPGLAREELSWRLAINTVFSFCTGVISRGSFLSCGDCSRPEAEVRVSRKMITQHPTKRTAKPRRANDAIPSPRISGASLPPRWKSRTKPAVTSSLVLYRSTSGRRQQRPSGSSAQRSRHDDAKRFIGCRRTDSQLGCERRGITAAILLPTTRTLTCAAGWIMG